MLIPSLKHFSERFFIGAVVKGIQEWLSHWLPFVPRPAYRCIQCRQWHRGECLSCEACIEKEYQRFLLDAVHCPWCMGSLTREEVEDMRADTMCPGCGRTEVRNFINMETYNSP